MNTRSVTFADPVTVFCQLCGSRLQIDRPFAALICDCPNCRSSFSVDPLSFPPPEPAPSNPRIEAQAYPREEIPVSIAVGAEAKSRFWKIFGFKGRLNRQQYLSGFVVRWAITLTGLGLGLLPETFWFGWIFVPVLLIGSWLSLSITVRRLRDMGEPAWALALIAKLPLINFIVWGMCISMPGKKSTTYGAIPTGSTPWG